MYTMAEAAMDKTREQRFAPYDLLHIETALYEQGYKLVCGVDEVGRGPLAGPVVAAVVAVPSGVAITGVDDSKKLPCRRREELFDTIIQMDLPCAVGIIDHVTIDRVNILRASLLAMHKALRQLPEQPDCILVDGNYTIPNVRTAQFAIVDGDARCQAIAAASIIAKVTRDRIMARYEQLYPRFTFSEHKGYPTP